MNVAIPIAAKKINKATAIKRIENSFDKKLSIQKFCRQKYSINVQIDGKTQEILKKISTQIERKKVHSIVK
jgi:hypothetical protein